MVVARLVAPFIASAVYGHRNQRIQSTLITKALNERGAVIGELPEQMMYLEWKHSAFEGEQKSCQSCHMPAVAEEMASAGRTI